MKCEIINGWLVVEPGTPTERYAFAQWLESRPSWNSVQSSVRAHDPKIDAPELSAMPPYPPVAQPVEG